MEGKFNNFCIQFEDNQPPEEVAKVLEVCVEKFRQLAEEWKE